MTLGKTEAVDDVDVIDPVDVAHVVKVIDCRGSVQTFISCLAAGCQVIARPCTTGRTEVQGIARPPLRKGRLCPIFAN